MPVENHQRTLTLQVSHKFRNAILRWDPSRRLFHTLKHTIKKASSHIRKEAFLVLL